MSGHRRRWSEELIERELDEVVSELGHWPSRKELLDMGKGRLLAAMEKRGGLVAWARRIGEEEPRRRGERHWTESRIRQELTSFLTGRDGPLPSRREFAEAGLLGLYRSLEDRRELDRWAAEFGLDPPRRGRPPGGSA